MKPVSSLNLRYEFSLLSRHTINVAPKYFGTLSSESLKFVSRRYFSFSKFMFYKFIIYWDIKVKNFRQELIIFQPNRLERLWRMSQAPRSPQASAVDVRVNNPGNGLNPTNQVCSPRRQKANHWHWDDRRKRAFMTVPQARGRQPRPWASDFRVKVPTGCRDARCLFGTCPDFWLLITLKPDFGWSEILYPGKNILWWPGTLQVVCVVVIITLCPESEIALHPRKKKKKKRKSSQRPSLQLLSLAKQMTSWI